MSGVANCQAEQSIQPPNLKSPKQERSFCLFRLASRVCECVRSLLQRLRRFFCAWFSSPAKEIPSASLLQSMFLGGANGSDSGEVINPPEHIPDDLFLIDLDEQRHKRFPPTIPISTANASTEASSKPELNLEERAVSFNYTPLHVFCTKAICSFGQDGTIALEYTDSGACYFPDNNWEMAGLIREYEQILSQNPTLKENPEGLSPLQIVLGAVPTQWIGSKSDEDDRLYKKAYWGSLYQTRLGELVDLLTGRLLEHKMIDPVVDTSGKGESPLHLALFPSTLGILYEDGIGDSITKSQDNERTPLFSTLLEAITLDPGHLFEKEPRLISLQKADWLLEKGALFPHEEKNQLMNRLLSALRLGEIPSNKGLQIYNWLIEKGAEVEDERVSEVLRSSFSATPLASSLEISRKLFEEEVPISPEDVSRFVNTLTLALESRDLEQEELEFLLLFVEKDAIPTSETALLDAFISRFNKEEPYQRIMHSSVDSEKGSSYAKYYYLFRRHILVAVSMIDKGFPLNSSVREGAFFAAAKQFQDYNAFVQETYYTLDRATKPSATSR